MTNTITLTMTVTDEEKMNLLDRIANRADVAESGATAPAAPVAAPVAPAAPVGLDETKLDVNGVVWNPLYHAKTQNTNKDGTWKALRGMDPTTKQAATEYEASFSAVAPAAPAAPVASPTEAEVHAEFARVIAAIGQPALLEKLGEIYTNAGAPVDGSSIATDENHRRSIFDQLQALSPIMPAA